MIVLMAIFGTGFGWLGRHYQRSQLETATLKWITDDLGMAHAVTYDFELDKNGLYTADNSPPGPSWLKTFLGQNLFASVVELNLQIPLLIPNRPKSNARLETLDRLAAFGKLKSLTIATGPHSKTRLAITDLNALKSMKKLEELTLHNAMQLQSLKGLEQTDQLKWISLTNCPLLKNVDALQPHSKLKRGTFADCPILANIESLKGKALFSFEIQECPQIDNLGALKNQTSLTHLTIDRRSIDSRGHHSDLQNVLSTLTGLSSLTLEVNDNIEDLRFLENAQSLINLEVAFCDSLKSLRGLEHLRLTRLSLNSCENLNDISAIKGKRSLRQLAISRCKKLSSLDGIENLPKLTLLSVSLCERLGDVGGIVNVPNLERLVLSATGLQDLQSIQDLDLDLDELDLSHNRILKNLNGIKHVGQFKKLDLLLCDHLTDVGSLAECDFAFSVNLRFCDLIEDASSIEGCKYIRILDEP